jgi:hypothetical protein
VAKLAAAGLGQAGLEGLEHAGQLGASLGGLELVPARHDATSSGLTGGAGPCRCTGAVGGPGRVR